MVNYAKRENYAVHSNHLISRRLVFTLVFVRWIIEPVKVTDNREAGTSRSRRSHRRSRSLTVREGVTAAPVHIDAAEA